jgi:hypothetical protein
MKRPLVLVAAAGLFLSACADGDDGGDGSSTTTGPTAATAVDVSAKEYAFDVPAKVTGGVVEMRFTNTGGLPHEFAFARIEEGKTEADIRAVIDSERNPRNGLRT